MNGKQALEAVLDAAFRFADAGVCKVQFHGMKTPVEVLSYRLQDGKRVLNPIDHPVDEGFKEPPTGEVFDVELTPDGVNVYADDQPVVRFFFETV